MNFKFTVFKISLFFFLLPNMLFCQEKTVSGIDPVAGEWVKNIRAASKKIILIHTDKYIYTAGDTIWFKVYTADSISGKLVTQKRILYVDLVDSSDQPITQLFLRNDRLQTGGMMILADTMRSGYYWLRSYSHFQPDEKKESDMSIIPIMVINPRKLSTANWVPVVANSGNGQTSAKMSAQIFPESGSYMSGANNLVVVKIEDEYGNSLAVSGMISDKQSKEVASFTTNNSGLGRFIFSPTPHGKYNLYAKSNHGNDSLMALPKVNLYAAQISLVEQSEQSIRIKVMLEDSLYSRNYTSYFLAVNKDSICYAAVGQGMYELNISLQNFQSGVAHLLLFNDQGSLLAGRDVYLRKRIPIVTITADKNNFREREKVKIDIGITDVSGKSVQAMLSVAVTDARLSDTSSMTFADPLEQDSPSNVDMLMVTHRLIKPLPDVEAKSQVINIYSLINPFIYKGQLVNQHKKPLQGYEIFMIANKRELILLKDTTDINGRFKIVLPEFDGRMEFNVKVKNLHGSNDEYLILPEHVQYPSIRTPEALKNKWLSWRIFLAKRMMEKHLDTVFSTMGKGILPPVVVRKKVANPHAEASFLLTQEQLLQNGMNTIGLSLLIVPGVHMNMGYLVIGGYTAFNPSATDEPILIMDGIQVQLEPDENGSPILKYLNSISVRDIEYIRVMTGPDASVYGSRGGHGAVEIKSASKRFEDKYEKDNIKVFLSGYHVPVPFSIYDKDNKNVDNKNYMDRRSTRFWNSDLITDKSGKTSIYFYTGDATTSYIVTVAGITMHGEKIFKSVVLSGN